MVNLAESQEGTHVHDNDSSNGNLVVPAQVGLYFDRAVFG
jgi:hypothetical protein